MNKKGYTLVELIAIISIIGLLFTIATISYNYLINKSNITVYEAYREGMHEAAITYVMENPIKDTDDEKDATITLEELITSNKIDYINNPKNQNDKCLNSYIDINRNDVNGVVSYEYNVCLICDDYNEEVLNSDACRWEMYSESIGSNCSSKPENPVEYWTYNECYNYLGYSFETGFDCRYESIQYGTGKTVIASRILQYGPSKHHLFFDNEDDAREASRSFVPDDIDCISLTPYFWSVGKYYNQKSYYYKCETGKTLNSNCKTFIN